MTRYRDGITRASGWLTGPIESALCCPHGHRIRDGWIVAGEQAVRCQYRDARHAVPCGVLLWVVTTRQGAAFVAEIDHEDLRIIKGLTSVHAALRYLGAPLWITPTHTRTAA